jgi:hypothetical protein
LSGISSRPSASKDFTRATGRRAGRHDTFDEDSCRTPIRSSRRPAGSLQHCPTPLPNVTPPGQRACRLDSRMAGRFRPMVHQESSPNLARFLTTESRNRRRPSCYGLGSRFSGRVAGGGSDLAPGSVGSCLSLPGERPLPTKPRLFVPESTGVPEPFKLPHPFTFLT